MLKYYQQIIQEKCREMRLPAKVIATAIMYHKRFFLRHTSMEYDPGRVMITAIFMATKIEEHYTRASDIAAAMNVTEDLVVKQEVALLEGLDFDLVIHSPYRALQGLIQELKEARAAAAAGRGALSPADAGLPPLDEPLAAAPEPLVVDACRRAVGAVDALLLSDAPLLYGPAQVAAAALRSGFKAKGLRAEAAAALTAALDELDALGSEGARRVEVDEVKEANAAAREWRTLLKDGAGGAKAGGAAAAEDGARAAKREAKKAARAAAKSKMEADLLGMPQG